MDFGWGPAIWIGLVILTGVAIWYFKGRKKP